MIAYMIYSTLCMGLLLLFYHAFLSKEKMYYINRGYLLFGLLFSLVVLFIPVGITGSAFPWVDNPPPAGISPDNASTTAKPVPQAPVKASGTENSSYHWAGPLGLFLYGVVTLFLFIRLLRNLYLIQSKVRRRNPVTYFEGHKVVLLKEEVVPHTFFKTIFLNKKQYENGDIGKEVLVHELAHAKQNHSFDIVFVELLKAIFWFNPFIYLYKKAIQLNHEFIADQRVLSRGADIAEYQALLLNMRIAQTARPLGNSLNYKVTKKRFQMMTQSTSTFRSFLKITATIPFFVILGMIFGCEPANISERETAANDIRIELSDSGTIKLNGNTVQPSEFESRFSKLPIDKEKSVIHLSIHPDVSIGTLMDVQQIIRKQGALKINYSPNKAEHTSAGASTGLQ